MMVKISKVAKVANAANVFVIPPRSSLEILANCSRNGTTVLAQTWLNPSV
jgi:hypothetical protein